MRRTLWLSVVLASSLAAANPVQTFSQGSLIIPMDANFQTQCGVTSAYGLVWKILYENRVGGGFAGSPVDIYWVINDLKSSPNRCVPSNEHASPTPLAQAAGVAGWDTGPWNDGCDLSIPNGTGTLNTGSMPVVPVNYTTAWPATNMYPFAALPEFDSNPEARPSYSSSAKRSTARIHCDLPRANRRLSVNCNEPESQGKARWEPSVIVRPPAPVATGV